MKKIPPQLLCLLLLFPLCELSAQHEGHIHEPAATQSAAREEMWTCAMHPSVKQKTAGQCPICGMDLVPVVSDTSSGIEIQQSLSATAEKLADIQTTPVERRFVTKSIRLAGTVGFDETKLTKITAWVAGRIERMFVDFTGISVKAGDHMLEIYSPELISAQEELLQIQRSLQRLQNSPNKMIKRSTSRAFEAAKEKLILLGLSRQQVATLLSRGSTQDKVIIYAPKGGVVVERSATEGSYVNKGTPIYSIADLSSLWINLDVYESQLVWVRYGQHLTFTTKALPGHTFKGTISYISYTLNPENRTTRVRATVENEHGLLKPGMFVKGTIVAETFAEGKVMNTRLKGKFVGPMHPEIIQETPGTCPICGMSLVPANELGYITEKKTTEPPLVIPSTAPLLTGLRAIVFVREPDKPVFTLREVVLGPEVDGFYIVQEGLKEGELVVSNGAFKIDADLQISGKPSMMNSNLN